MWQSFLLEKRRETTSGSAPAYGAPVYKEGGACSCLQTFPQSLPLLLPARNNTLLLCKHCANVSLQPSGDGDGGRYLEGRDTNIYERRWEGERDGIFCLWQQLYIPSTEKVEEEREEGREGRAMYIQLFSIYHAGTLLKLRRLYYKMEERKEGFNLCLYYFFSEGRDYM